MLRKITNLDINNQFSGTTNLMFAYRNGDYSKARKILGMHGNRFINQQETLNG